MSIVDLCCELESRSVIHRFLFVFLLLLCMKVRGALCVDGPLVCWGRAQVCLRVSFPAILHVTVECNSLSFPPVLHCTILI